LFAPKQPWKGTILPFSGDRPGDAHLDWNAGITGMAKDAAVGGYNALTGLSQALMGRLPPGVDPVQKTIEGGLLGVSVNPAVRAGDRLIPAAREVISEQFELAPEMAARAGAPTAREVGIEGPALEMRQVPSYEPVRNMVRPPAPTGAELKAASDAGFETARGMGVDYHGEAVARIVQELQARLMKEGISPSDAARTYPKLDVLASPPQGANSSFSELYSARKAFGRIAQDYNANAEDRMAATMAIKTIDDFFENPIPSSVLAGPAAAVGQIAKEARGNAAAAFRSQDLVANQASAELKSAVANSGRNVDNAIRQRAGYLVDPLHPERMSGFSAEEKAAIEAVAKGTPLRNNLRYVGNLLGGGGGLGMAMTGMGAGALGGSMGSTATGAAAGLAFPAIGASSKAIANALAKRAMGRADELVRSRSPLAAAAPGIPAPTAAREAALKALILALQERQDSRHSGGGGY
jgi:hypothetical protein